MPVSFFERNSDINYSIILLLSTYVTEKIRTGSAENANDEMKLRVNLSTSPVRILSEE